MKLEILPVFHSVSPQAAAISDLFKLVLGVCGAILLIVSILVVVGLVRYRERPGSPPSGGFRPENKKLEILWTLGPALIVLFLFVLTVRGMKLSDPSGIQDPDIIIVGHQWWWEVRYPVTGQTDIVTANEVHIPTGKKLRVRLEAADVIHDFWVPELARKMQTIPGHPNAIWLEADSAGNYQGDCVEYCGVQHSWMRISVVAQPPAEFENWLRQQKNPAATPGADSTVDSTRSGMNLFQAMTCVSCHSIRGVSGIATAGPDLTHFASRKTLGAGVLTNTPENLYTWLKNPQAIKPGCFMPNLKLTDAQAHALLAYLETLQ